MTEQIVDTCLYDGRTWEVEDLGSLVTLVPSSESLGFDTILSSTANLSGRVDHFVIWQDELYLHKMEVNLAPEYIDHVPSYDGISAGKEVVTRYEPMTRTDSEGTRDDWWKHEFVYFVFGGGNLKIKGTGEIRLLYPHIDLWEIPYTDDEEDLFTKQVRAVLTFDNGQLVYERIEQL